MRMVNWWLAFAAFLLVAVGLLFAVFFKALGVDLEYLRVNAQGFSGLQSVVTIFAILAAGTIAFVKFFAHGQFVRRANLSMSVHVHRKDAGHNWHTVEIVVENKGNLALIVKSLEWDCRHFHGNGDRKDDLGNDLFLPPGHKPGTHVIVSGESERMMMEPYTVRRDAVLSAYRAIFTDITGKSWFAYCVISAPVDDNDR